ncbi:MAG: heme exporter protein CcmB [Candidatus Binatia bacterium]
MLALIRKDLLLQARRKEVLASLFVLGVLMLLAFNFSIDIAPDNVGYLAPGILWVSILFSTTLALGHSFLGEKEQGCMNALLMSPLDRGSIFLAKFAVNLLLIMAFEALFLPVFGLFFAIDLRAFVGPLAAVMIGGTIGLTAIGTLFALVAIGSRSRELMLPLLVLPLELPLLIAAVKATAVVMAGKPLSAAGGWGNMLIGFDVLFVTAGWLAFEYVSSD